MPTYEYLCGACGPFTAFKPIARYKDPEPCPVCAAVAPRVIMTAPAVRGASKPDSAASAPPTWLGGMKRHGGGCSCC